MNHKFDPQKKYVEVWRVNDLLKDLGYANGTGGRLGCTHYQVDPAKAPHLPSHLTLSYQEEILMGRDGQLWYGREPIFDLLDRLSDLDPGDGMVIKAIRKLDA